MSDRRTVVDNNFGDGARIHLGDNHYNCSHDDRKKCLSDLRVTDPKDDKKRIEKSKDGLIRESYQWILGHDGFKQWMKLESDSRFLWIKGDPGKGKTMLLAGIIDELNDEPSNTYQIAYFFCQETDSRINNATAVLRGLIYMLVKSQESLLVHVWKEYEHAGEQLFKDCNAFTVLSRILTAIVADSELKEAVLIVDALDECVTDLQLLLELIVELSHSKVRWIVSSRNWPEIDVLQNAAQKHVLCLELNQANISRAVKTFIAYRVGRLTKRKGLDAGTKQAIQEYMESNCNETFLWVALAFQLLDDPRLPAWKIETTLRQTPAGLNNIYRRMLHYALESYCLEDCKQILKLAITAYRPLAFNELLSLWDPSENTPFDKDILQQIIHRVGSFLIVRDNIVYFIHQSAKDYLVAEAVDELGLNNQVQHFQIFDRCLNALNLNLRRNIYSLEYPGFPIGLVKPPHPDPLAPLKYCSMYWVSHLCDSGLDQLVLALQTGSRLEKFLWEKSFNWIEAIGLMQILSHTLQAIKRLQELVVKIDPYSHSRTQREKKDLRISINNIYRMLCCFEPAIAAAPLQIYASGLTFCPEALLDSVSNTRKDAQDEVYQWNISNLNLLSHWSPRIQSLAIPETLHSDDKFIVSTHDGFMVTTTSIHGKFLLQKSNVVAPIQLHGSGRIDLGVYSTDCTRFAGLSLIGSISIWDLERESVLRSCSVWAKGFFRTSKFEILPGDALAMTFTSDRNILLLAFNGRIESWDIAKNVFSQKLNMGKLTGTGHYMFGCEGTRLAIDKGGRIEIWNLDDNCMIQHFTRGRHFKIRKFPLPVAFSCDGDKFVMVENHRLIVYDLDKHRNLCFDTRRMDLCHLGRIMTPPVFTKSGKIAMAYQNGIRLWSTNGTYLATINMEINGDWCFSADETQIASVDFTDNVTILDVELSVENDQMNVWDTQSGALSRSLEIQGLHSVDFSSDLRWAAGTSNDGLVRFWDTRKGALVIEAPYPGMNIQDNGRLYFSHPDSNLVAIWSPDSEITIWNLCSRSRKPHIWKSQSKIAYFSSNGAQPFAFSFLNSEFFLSHPRNGIEVYNYHTGVCERTFKLPYHPSEDLGLSYVFSLSNDGLRLVVHHPLDRSDFGILDTRTGSCLIRARSSSLDIGADARMVHTRYGVLDRHQGHLTETGSEEGWNGQFHIYMSDDGSWIMREGMRIIWVPYDFRSRAPKVVGNSVVCWEKRGGLVCLRFV